MNRLVITEVALGSKDEGEYCIELVADELVIKRRLTNGTEMVTINVDDIDQIMRAIKLILDSRKEEE